MGCHNIYNHSGFWSRFMGFAIAFVSYQEVSSKETDTSPKTSRNSRNEWIFYLLTMMVIRHILPWPFPLILLPPRWFGGLGGAYNGTMPSFGFQLELFNASRCNSATVV